MMATLEERFMEEVLRPAIGPAKTEPIGYPHSISQTLDFVKLLNNVREFYTRAGGKNWCDIVLASKI